MSDNLNTGKLFLLPNVLFEEDTNPFLHLPSSLQEIVPKLDGLIAESEKDARRYLKRFAFPEGRTFREVPLRLLNEHTTPKELAPLLDPMIQGEVWGLVSDAGLPCIADPGSSLVALARKKKIPVQAISGPSSLFLGLMLSGLSAQKFCFHGYLERDSTKLRLEIQSLEKESIQKKMTQVFIEAPYRSLNLFTALLETLQDSTMLSFSCNLTASDAVTETFSIRDWKKKEKPDLHKKPTVFIFLA
jgi:16S rRNA (cytidine1402-2'-O)-methyltransferase